jgi:hypothetical protein
MRSETDMNAPLLDNNTQNLKASANFGQSKFSPVQEVSENTSNGPSPLTKDMNMKIGSADDASDV